MKVKDLVASVLEIYHEDDIETLNDLQFYIMEQFEAEVPKDELAKYFNEKIKMDEQDIKLQFKHLL